MPGERIKDRKPEALCEPKDMTGWYDPSQLAKTGAEALLAMIFGKRADTRVLQRLTGKDKIFEYTARAPGEAPEAEPTVPPQDRAAMTADGEIWIDYLADTGDGFNSTFAVAETMARPQLTGEGLDAPLPAGEIVIMGGDQVYPTATRREYWDRLRLPFAAAYRDRADDLGTADNMREVPEDTEKFHPKPFPPRTPHLFAIPGNHDWYDGLVAFTKIFTQERRFGRLKTMQDRSYFALKLPGGWWLLGADTQLEHDIDNQQLDYFRDTVVSRMQPGDRVILCVAEPEWVHHADREQNRADDDALFGSTMGLLEKAIIDAGAEVTVWLAGDLHHYRHHVHPPEAVAKPGTADPGYDNAKAKWHKITCGGGGAFLHPTHLPVKAELESRSNGTDARYAESYTYPTRDQSKGLAWRNFLFPYNNPWFGLVTAFAYLAVGWVTVVSARSAAKSQGVKDASAQEAASGVGWVLQVLEQIAQIVVTAVNEPLGLVILLTVIVGFIAFTDSRSQAYRRVAGPIHALAHLTAAIVISWAAARTAINLADGLFAAQTVDGITITGGESREFVPVLFRLFIGGIIVLPLGYLVGGMIMGTYLFIAVRVFNQHGNEGFSSLAWDGYKSFLRIRVRNDGSLTIYPIGIDEVPQWKKRGKKLTVPEDLAFPATGEFETKAHLIGVPIEIPARSTT